MKIDLKDILVENALPKLRGKVSGKALFNPRSNEGQLVAEIIEEVRKKRDKAISAYTEKYDGIKLAPAQFRIPAQGLKKAHTEIDKKLLKSIKRSISNVRKYQEEIFSSDITFQVCK